MNHVAHKWKKVDKDCYKFDNSPKIYTTLPIINPTKSEFSSGKALEKVRVT